VRRFGSMVLAITLTAALGAACSSSTNDGAGSPASSRSTGSTAPNGVTTPTADPNEQPNPIPYNVGEAIGLPNGWKVRVAKVHRPYAAPELPLLPAGQQYVGVDLVMSNDGTEPVIVDTRRIFTVTDASGASHAVVSGAAGATGLDKKFAAGVDQSGTLVFAVPERKDLQLMLDGPAIHTARSVFQVDPPTTPVRD